MRTRTSTNTSNRIELPEPSLLVTPDGRLLVDSGGASATSEDAVEVTPYAAGTTVDGTGKTIAEILTGVAEKYLIRYALITADTDNASGDDLAIRKGTLGVIFTPPISAGGSWKIEAPDGTFFDANLLRVVALQNTPDVVVFAMR